MALTDPIVAPVAAMAPARSVQWGAVVLGTLGAMAISAVLLTFGAGIGLSAVSAQPYAGASAKALAVISALYTAVSLVAAFAAGGYITGRMRSLTAAEDIEELDFRDGAHGFGVWALAIVLGGALALSGVSGAVKLGVQSTAALGGATLAGAASNPELANRISMTPTDYAVDRLMAPSVPAAPAANAAPAPAPTTPPADTASAPATAPAAAPTPAPAASTMAPRSRMEVTAPINRTFAAAVKSGSLDARDRTTLVAMVMQQTGLPQAEAEKRVDEAYADLKTAEAKARDAAEKARKAALITAFALAATLLLGCAAACAGATAGAHHRRENVPVAFFGSRRFW
jgi:hypothetical protein